MSRTAIWAGGILVAAGLCGMLDAAGLAPWSETIGRWWPLILVVWASADMLADRRVTLAGLVWAALGVALLSDGLQWTSDTLTWSAFAAFVGLALLTEALAKVSAARNGAAPSRPSAWEVSGDGR